MVLMNRDSKGSLAIAGLFQCQNFAPVRHNFGGSILQAMTWDSVLPGWDRAVEALSHTDTAVPGTQ